MFIDAEDKLTVLLIDIHGNPVRDTLNSVKSAEKRFQKNVFFFINGGALGLAQDSFSEIWDVHPYSSTHAENIYLTLKSY